MPNEAGAGGGDYVAVVAGGEGRKGAPRPVKLIARSDSSAVFSVGNGGAGGEAPQLPPGPPYGTSTTCGDAILGADEECDDGVGGADACTAACQTRDEAVDEEGTSDRYLGAGRHPVAGLEDGFITTYMQVGTDDVEVGATLFDIWGKPAHYVTVSEGASPIDEANPVAAALPDGSYAVAWGDFDGDGSDLGIALRRAESDGSLGPLLAANSGTEFSQLNPDMIWTGSELVVAWEDYADAFNGPDLRYRTFDGDLNPTSDDVVLAASELPEAAVALTVFDGGWAAAYREGAADGSEYIVVKADGDSFRIGPVYGGPLDDRPALVKLDATHLLVVFSAGTDPAATGLYNVPRIRYSVVDTAGSLTPAFQSLDPMDDVVTRDTLLSHLSPSVAKGSDGFYVAWRSEARIMDAAGDQLWLKYLRWQPATQPQLDTREAEVLVPRILEGSIGDQRGPALARVELPPSGALAMAWTDYAKHQGQGEPDVVVQYAPTHQRDAALGQVFEEKFVGADGAPWSSHWTAALTGNATTSLERERGKVASPGATGVAVMHVNHHNALNVDISTDLRFNLNGAIGGIIVRRTDDDSDSYLGARFGTSATEEVLKVYAVIDNVRTDIKNFALPPSFSVLGRNIYFRMRFKVTKAANGSIDLAAKYWTADAPEPATWMIQENVAATSTIGTRFANRSGRFGLIGSETVTNRTTTFDNFRAVFFEGSGTGNLDAVQPVGPLRRGKAAYRPCTPTNKCDAGDGSCFDDSECNTGLACVAAVSSLSPWEELGSHVKTCAPSHCGNLKTDADELSVDCGGADCPPCTCVPTAAPGAGGFCTNTCPCGAGGTDCTVEENCLTNMLCGQELGYKYGFANGTDACVPSHCMNRIVDADEDATAGRPDWGGSCGSPTCNNVNGSYAHCSVFCKCASGHGDCGYDDDCAAGLKCTGNRGAKFPPLTSGVDVCLPPHCSNNVLETALGEVTKDCGGECGTPCP